MAESTWLVRLYRHMRTARRVLGANLNPVPELPAAFGRGGWLASGVTASAIAISTD
jgi:hypothetical protein